MDGRNQADFRVAGVHRSDGINMTRSMVVVDIRFYRTSTENSIDCTL